MVVLLASLGSILQAVTLVFLLVAVVVGLAAVVGLAILPGWIASKRNHPQVKAVQICGIFGLPTGILWVVALAWAYWRYPGEPTLASANASPTELAALREQIDQLESVVTQWEQQQEKGKR